MDTKRCAAVIEAEPGCWKYVVAGTTFGGFASEAEATRHMFANHMNPPGGYVVYSGQAAWSEPEREPLMGRILNGSNWRLFPLLGAILSVAFTLEYLLLRFIIEPIMVD